MSKTIPLSGKNGVGKFAIVDDDDYERMCGCKWYIGHKGHVLRTVYSGGKRTVYMHREVAQCPKQFQVDHANGNPLDNRKENLRVCTHEENMRNRKPESGTSSVYKGVVAHRKKWKAQICANGKQIFLGTFNSEIDAAKAYDKAATLYHGRFARLNF